MASTQVVSLNSVGQMKQVHFPPESIDRPQDEAPTPHFVSPKKIVRATSQRKRSVSFSLENKHHFKRRRKEDFVRPTKFLLGGNSRDPLNLGSLADERINKALNEHTPESSPLPTPKHRKEEIEVLIPPNIRDPLNLSVPDDDLAERALISPSGVAKKKKTKSRKRKRTNSASEVLDAGQNPTEIKTSIEDLIACKEVVTDVALEETVVETNVEVAAPSGTSREFKELKLKPDCIRHARRPEDKIVSPVVPQPGARKRCGFFARTATKEASNTKNQSQRQFTRTNFKEPSSSNAKQQTEMKEVKTFQYGNYDRYYGYRTPNFEDPRLRCFRQGWLEDKDVLDIGCNAGHATICVAQEFNPKTIVGIDIDPKLITMARNNVKRLKSNPKELHFPVSMPMMFGPIPKLGSHTFPNNISFVQGNYVPESEELLEMVQPEYDTILCLSVTKWVHLNWGDSGLKRFFRRIYANLRPGGRLILEAQGWASYNKRKKLTVT